MKLEPQVFLGISLALASLAPSCFQSEVVEKKDFLQQ